MQICSRASKNIFTFYHISQDIWSTEGNKFSNINASEPAFERKMPLKTNFNNSNGFSKVTESGQQRLCNNISLNLALEIQSG